MKLTIKKIIFLSFLFLSACQFLSPDPVELFTNDKALNSRTEVEKALNGIYDGLQDQFLYGKMLYVAGELMAGNLKMADKQTLTPFEKEFLDLNFTASNEVVRNIWQKNYEAINRANQVIASVSVVSDSTIRNQWHGEALLLRSMLHFEMLRYFADPNKKLGIPYRMMPLRQIEYFKRDSIQTVYKNLMTDTQKAIGLLASKEINPNRANVWAAKMFLCRLYLAQNLYNQVLSLSTEIIDQSPFRLNGNPTTSFRSISVADQETIFRLQSTASDNSTALLNQTFNPLLENGGKWVLANSLIETLREYERDLRWGSFYFQQNSQVFVRKFDTRGGEPSTMHLPIMRLSEVYLMRSEANLLLGASLQTIRSDFNRIRLRADLPIDNAASSQERVLSLILAERKRELFLEGQTFHDLKRTKQNIGGLPPENSRLVLPIPQAEMVNNPNMVQNTGY